MLSMGREGDTFTKAGPPALILCGLLAPAGSGCKFSFKIQRAL